MFWCALADPAPAWQYTGGSLTDGATVEDGAADAPCSQGHVYLSLGEPDAFGGLAVTYRRVGKLVAWGQRSQIRSGSKMSGALARRWVGLWLEDAVRFSIFT